MSIRESNFKVAVYVRKFSKRRHCFSKKEIKRKYAQKLSVLMKIGIWLEYIKMSIALINQLTHS